MKNSTALLREAFDATLTDPEYLADAVRMNFETRLVRNEEIDALLEKALRNAT